MPAPQFSEDHRWWWTGTQWVPVATPPVSQHPVQRRTRPAWPFLLLLGGLILATLGIVFVVANSQGHHECQSLLIDVLANHTCHGIDARYTEAASSRSRVAWR